MRHRFLILTVMLILGPLSINASRAAACLCNCAAFGEFKAQVSAFETELDQGMSALMTPALQSKLTCLEPCAERWMQCPMITNDHLEAAGTSRTLDNAGVGVRMTNLNDNNAQQRH